MHIRENPGTTPLERRVAFFDIEWVLLHFLTKFTVKEYYTNRNGSSENCTETMHEIIHHTLK